MVITTQFDSGDLAWFVSPWSLEATQAEVLDILITVDASNVVVIQYNFSADNIPTYIDSTKCFATQEELAASYAAP